MDSNISIIRNLKEDVILSLVEYELIEKEEYNLLIVPDTGAWATIPQESMNYIKFLQTPRLVSEIQKENKQALEDFVDNLFYSGIVKANGKDVSFIDNNRKTENTEKGKNGLPFFWVLKYTNNCNLRCSYCYSYNKKIKQPVILPNDYVYKVSELIGVTDNTNKPLFCFHGGEPLIRFNDIVECVENLKTQRNGSIEFSIQTNGTLLTPKIAKYLKQEHFSVGISIDGYNEHTNRLRLYANNKPSVNASINAIKHCINEGITPGIISVMTNANCGYAIDIMRELSNIGIKSFHFIHFLPNGRGEHKEKDFSIPTEELLDIRIKMLLFINDYNSTIEQKNHIHERLTNNIIKSLTHIGEISYMCAQSPCGAGRRMMALNYDGNIYPCDDFCNNSSFKVGNINEITDLKSCISQSKSVKLCQSHCIENIPKCRECLYKRICVSHCCSDSYYYTGIFNSPHSACEFIKQFIPIIIDLLYKGRIQVENLIK